MKTRILSIAIVLILGVLLFSWVRISANQTDAVDVGAIRTEAVATYASSLSLTKTLVAVPSATSTRTAVPTLTLPAITLTVEPSATTNPCYNLRWLADVTIPDGTQMKADETFTKTWQVKNNGVCTWRAGFTFNNVGGDPMQGNTLILKEPIPTGSKTELSIKLVVPGGQNGLIQSSWRMADDNGSFFGDTLSVNILVGDITTPAVTSTP